MEGMDKLTVDLKVWAGGSLGGPGGAVRPASPFSTVTISLSFKIRVLISVKEFFVVWVVLGRLVFFSWMVVGSFVVSSVVGVCVVERVNQIILGETQWNFLKQNMTIYSSRIEDT
jgi:hypothetical protein